MPNNVAQNNVTITKLLLSAGNDSVDLSLIFSSMSIYEDMYANCVSGHISISDARGLVESLPIIGEETLDVEYTTFTNPNAVKTFSFKFDVVKLEDYFVEDDNTIHHYTLHFQSPIMNLNLKNRLRIAYGTPDKYMRVSDIVDSVCKNILNTTAKIDPSETYRHVVCANWTPFQLINYLAETSRPDGTLNLGDKNCSYMFFEDRFGVKFVSLSTMIEGKLYTNPNDTVIDTLVMHQEASKRDKVGVVTSDINKALEWQSVNLFSSNDNTRSGMYGSTTYYVNPLKKSVDVVTYDYSNDYQNQSKVDNQPYRLTRDRVNSSYEASYMYDAKYNHNNVIPIMKSKHSQLNNNVLAVTVVGSSAYRLGQILTFDIPSVRVSNGKREIIKYLSGEFLLSRIKTTLTQTNIVCDLELRKGCRRSVL